MTLLQAVQASVGQWGPALTTIATELFGALAVISLVFAIGWAYLNGDGLVGMFAVALRLVIWLGLWTFILRNWAGGLQFGHAIIASFQSAAQQAGGIPSSPVDVMNEGTALAMRIMKLGTWWEAAAMVLAASCVAVSFYIVAALMLMSLVKAYIVIGTGTIFLGFAGSEHTMHMARNVFGAAIGSGARLFSIQLLASIGATIIQAWMGQATVLDEASMWTTIGLAIVYCVVILTVPASVEAMANWGHARAGPGEAVRTVGQTMMVGSGVTNAALQLSSSIGSTGSAAVGLLTGNSRGSNTPSSGGGATGGSAGARMAPQGARFTRSP